MTYNPNALYDKLNQSFKQATKNKGLVEKNFQLGFENIKINFAGEELVKYCIPAIKHLSIKNPKYNSCTISVFDSKSTNTKILLDLWSDFQNNSTENNFIHVRNYFTDGNIKVIYHSENKTISIFNIATNHGIVWYSSSDSIPFYSISSPFRSLFHWCFLEKDMQLIHAGAIGYKDNGVLLVGPSGSGKTSTVISCIQSRLKFAGDDHIIVNIQNLKAYCIYNAFKLKREDLPKYKNLLEKEVAFEDDNYEKSIYLMNNIDSKKIIKSFKINAIIIPVITHSKISKLTSTSSAQGLLALSPNTIFQLPGSGKKEYENIVRLVRKIPVYKLELGSNSTSIFNQIDELIKVGN